MLIRFSYQKHLILLILLFVVFSLVLGMGSCYVEEIVNLALSSLSEIFILSYYIVEVMDQYLYLPTCH